MFFDPFNGSPLLNFWHQTQVHKALEESLAERKALEVADAARELAVRSVVPR